MWRPYSLIQWWNLGLTLLLSLLINKFWSSQDVQIYFKPFQDPCRARGEESRAHGEDRWVFGVCMHPDSAVAKKRTDRACLAGYDLKLFASVSIMVAQEISCYSNYGWPRLTSMQWKEGTLFPKTSSPGEYMYRITLGVTVVCPCSIWSLAKLPPCYSTVLLSPFAFCSPSAPSLLRQLFKIQIFILSPDVKRLIWVYKRVRVWFSFFFSPSRHTFCPSSLPFLSCPVVLRRNPITQPLLGIQHIEIT